MNVTVTKLSQIKQGMRFNNATCDYKTKDQAVFHHRDSRGFIYGTTIIDKVLLDNTPDGLRMELPN